MHMQQNTKTAQTLHKGSSMSTSRVSSNDNATSAGPSSVANAINNNGSDSGDKNGTANATNLLLAKQTLKGQASQSAANTNSVSNSASNSAGQVITVVAPSSSSQSHSSGQPVVVQMANNTQFIALAVPSDQVNQHSSNHSNLSSSNTDADDQSTNFDEFSSNTYTNGNNGTLTYYTTEPSFNSNSGYFNSPNVGQILSDGTYLVMEQADGSSITPTIAKGLADSPHDEDDVKQMLLHQQQRISVQPQTVKWLLDNYESAEGVSLPRSTLYTHYIEHCQQHGIDPVNAASFGKLIRSVFIGLRTRRLGTRGNSKYHYYGIRIKPGSSLASSLEIFGSAGGSPAQAPEKRQKLNSIGSFASRSMQHHHIYLNGQSDMEINLNQALINQLKPFLGDHTVILSTVWPDEPTFSSNDNESTSALLNRFAYSYRKHFSQIINAVGQMQFHLIEQYMLDFWQAKTVAGEKPLLTLEQLQRLTAIRPLEDDEEESANTLGQWIIQTDYTLYNSLITTVFLPDMLKVIPQQLSTIIRGFCRNLQNWMSQALVGYDPSFVEYKCSAVVAFSHTLRRYTSINHLISAVNPMFENTSQVQQMIADFKKIDFQTIQEQGNFLCQCDDQLIRQIYQSFIALFEDPDPQKKWSFWCSKVLEMCLQNNYGVKAATQFYFGWIVFSSMVLRDLTMRSVPTFGSFHLLRLLLDDYMYYLVENRIAKISNKTPLQVSHEVGRKRLTIQ